MKSALITGILGQDGTYLARWLVRNGYTVHGLIRGSMEREESRIHGRFPPDERAQIRFHTGALEDPFSLANVLKIAAPDEVYHLAGVSDSRQSFAIPEATVQSITIGTLRLLEAGRQLNPAIRYFLASSCEVFGVPSEEPQTEATARRPVTPYGVAKDASDHFARIYREKHGQFICTGILYNHESPLRPSNYLSSRVTKAVAAIKSSRLRELKLGNLEAQRDWSDARDFVVGYWLALQAETPDDYIFASGQSRSVAELVDSAFRAGELDYHEFVRVEAAQIGAVPVKFGLRGDATKAAKQLGWTRRWRFEETISDMVQAEIEERPFIARSEPQPPQQSQPARPSQP